jgi:hypothetical protein
MEPAASRADDCDEARRIQPGRQFENVIVAPDHSDQAAGQVGVRKIGSWRDQHAPLIARPRNRCHEAVAPPGQGRDISCAVLSIAERFAQTGDVKTQTAFFHGDVWPDLSQQIAFADDLVRI